MMKWRMTGAAVTAAAFLAIPAAAQNAPSSSVSCTSGGVKYGMGEYACIPVCHGERQLARCDVRTFGVSTAIGTWTYVSDACPSAMIINPRWPNDWTQLPVVTDMSHRAVVVDFSPIDPEIAPKIGSSWH